MNSLVQKLAQTDLQTVGRFLLVGGSTMVIYLAVFGLFRLFAAEVLALTVAYVAAVSFHFVANRIFTFRLATTTGTALPRYVVVLAISYLVTLAAYAFAVRLLGAPELLGLVVSVGCNTVATFLLLRYWVFRSRA